MERLNPRDKKLWLTKSVVMAALVTLISVSSAHADNDNNRGNHYGNNRNARAEYRDNRRDNRQWREHQNYNRRHWNNRYYSPEPTVVYAPPTYYYPEPVYQSPGLNFVFPLHIR